MRTKAFSSSRRLEGNDASLTLKPDLKNFTFKSSIMLALRSPSKLKSSNEFAVKSERLNMDPNLENDIDSWLPAKLERKAESV